VLVGGSRDGSDRRRKAQGRNPVRRAHADAIMRRLSTGVIGPVRQNGAIAA
jgi:hypothetical protein